MKVYAKDKLKYKNGMLVADSGDVVGIDPEIVDFANELETKVQKAQWLKTQPEACAGPNFAEFKRKGEDEIQGFIVETPLLDERAEQSMALMEELDSKCLNDKMNDQLMSMYPLMLFVKDDSVVDVNPDKLHKFDCPVLGNPLTWTEDTILNAIAVINNVEIIDAEIEVTNG